MSTNFLGKHSQRSGFKQSTDDGLTLPFCAHYRSMATNTIESDR
jgi:hypothetical protein